MALELETVIMREIGLGQHYNWFSGSGSCIYIAQSAARALSGAIQKHHDAGAHIAAPSHRLMALMNEAVEWDEDSYILTKAWQVASEAIAAHIHAAHAPAEEQSTFLTEREPSLRQYYEPEHAKRRRANREAMYFERDFGFSTWLDDED